jgi:hypothetical protein
LLWGGSRGAAAITKAYQRLVRKLEQDQEMAREIGRIEREMSRFKV